MRRAAAVSGALGCALWSAGCGGGGDDFSPPPGGFPWLAARFGRETTGEARCVVQAAVPTAHAYTPRPADACTDDAALALTMDACGRLSAEFEAQLLFGEDCARPEPCTLRMRWTARPIVFPTGAPADDVRPPPVEGTAPCD